MTLEQYEQTMTVKEKFEVGLKQAIASRGKNKGKLKSKCPPMDTFGSAVWQAIISYSNPYKMGFGHMLLMSKECREVYQYTVELGKTVDLTNLDSDGNTLRSLNLI